jgi:hypothetical protein
VLQLHYCIFLIYVDAFSCSYHERRNNDQDSLSGINARNQHKYGGASWFPDHSFCLATAIENLVCTRRAGESMAPVRSAHSVPDRATGTFPRARRGRARRWSMCGR